MKFHLKTTIHLGSLGFLIALNSVQADAAVYTETQLVTTTQQNHYRGVATHTFSEYDITWPDPPDRYYYSQTIYYPDGTIEQYGGSGWYGILATATWNTFYTEAGSGEDYTWTSGWATSVLSLVNSGSTSVTVNLKLIWTNLRSTEMAYPTGAPWDEWRYGLVATPGNQSISPPRNGVQLVGSNM